MARALAACCSAVVLLASGTAIADPGLAVSGLMGMPTEEGDAASFTVKLTSAPSSDVSLVVTTSLPDSAVVVPSRATFTPGNWLVPQTFWVMGLDDEIEDGDALVELEVAVEPGSDPDYVALPGVLRDTEVLDDETTLVVESGPIRCVGPATEDLYDGSTVFTMYDRDHRAAHALVFDGTYPEEDDVVYWEHSDERFVALRTLHVVLRNVLSGSMTDAQVESLGQKYAAAAHHIHLATGGLLMLDYDQVVVDDWYGAWAFGTPGTADEGGFVAYTMLRTDLLLEGYDVDDFDIVNVSMDISQQDVAPNFIPEQLVWGYAQLPDAGAPTVGGTPFSNANTWNNDRTWTTVQFASNPMSPGLRDVFVHEMNHSMEWMLQYGIYPEHRGADDAWWLATYPGYDLGSSDIDELEVLTMFWARPKHVYSLLPPTWGELRTRTPMHVVETSCPFEDTLKMRRAYCQYGVSCDTVCNIGMPCEYGCYCNEEPRGGGGDEGGGRG